MLAKNILSNSIGNILEWYDFALYGAMATIIAKNFFPSDIPLVSLILTFGVFASGFLMRPIGGILFGHMGDTKGRKPALLLSVLLMSVPTFLIAILPSYHSIGIFAPILLTLIRLFQGLAVGGEFTGTISYLIEIAPERKKAFYSSLSMSGVVAGVLLGSFCISITTHTFSTDNFEHFAWRFPFAFSIVLAFIIYQLRKHISETLDVKVSDMKSPVMQCLESHKHKMFQAFIVTILTGVSFWIVIVYSMTYFKLVNGGHSHFQTISIITTTMTMLLIPVMGYLGDKVGHIKIAMIAAIGFALVAIPFNTQVVHADAPIWFYHGFLCVLLAMYLSNAPYIIGSLFPKSIRYTALSISYNFALAIFGGTAPLITTYLLEHKTTPYAPGFVLTAAAVTSLVGLFGISSKPASHHGTHNTKSRPRARDPGCSP